MATSGVYSFNETRDEIILDALQGINVIGGNETSIPSEELGYCTRALNRIITEWAKSDMPLWERKEATLFFQYGQNSYDVGPTSTDIICSSFTNTTTSAAASSGATAIVVTSATGFAANQDVGVLLDSGYMQWTTIASVASTTINLDDALTDDVSSGVVVYTCTAGIQRPLKIIEGRVFNVDSSIDYPVEQINYAPYYQKTLKTLVATYPTQYAYSPVLDNGKLYFYPTPSTMTQVFKFTYHNPIQTFNASTDNADFPVEYLRALIDQLKADICRKYGMILEHESFKQSAAESKMIAMSMNKEEGNIEIKFNRGM